MLHNHIFGEKYFLYDYYVYTFFDSVLYCFIKRNDSRLRTTYFVHCVEIGKINSEESQKTRPHTVSKFFHTVTLYSLTSPPKTMSYPRMGVASLAIGS